MLEAAERMKALGRQPRDSGAPASIFGSALSLAQSIDSDERFRISLYPILCDDMPEIAMGLASCLGYLLEQYPSTRVYRCFAKIDPSDEKGEIEAADYQFTADEWELENLADNVLLSGALEATGGGLKLHLSLDASLIASDQDETLNYSFASLADAVAALPAVTQAVWRLLAPDEPVPAVIGYELPLRHAQNLDQLLECVFDWNLDTYLYLWGVAWDEADLSAQYREVARLSERGDEFACWCGGMMAQQVMQQGLHDLGETLAELIEGGGPKPIGCAPGAAALAKGLASLGYAERSINILAPFLTPEAGASIWLSMIEIQLDSGRFDDALDSNQVALEHGLLHPALYWQYAQLLMAAEANEWPMEEVLLIDPEDHDEADHIACEIAEALKHHLEGAPGNLAALQLALAYMIDVADEELWLYFERLIRQDQAGAYTGDIIERLLDLESYEPAYDILERHLDSNAYAHVFLAQLALADGDAELATETIADCRARLAELDEDLELELQSLELAARFPHFEEDFAELKLLLGANRAIGPDRIEQLEDAIEVAPKMIDLYAVLARCYRHRGESESAFEVLVEAEERAGPHPQIELGLAQLLWTSERRADAIDKLNAGLTAFPSDIPLLAQMANYLISNDQLDDAKQYIARAEAIAPSHRALWPLRRLIAQKMAG